MHLFKNLLSFRYNALCFMMHDDIKWIWLLSSIYWNYIYISPCVADASLQILRVIMIIDDESDDDDEGILFAFYIWRLY